MTEIQMDHYRLFGDDVVRFRSFQDYRFLYMYCWRKIKNKSNLTFFYKLILKNLRKHYHIEIPYTVEIGGGFSMDHAYNITINSRAKIGKNVTMYKGSTIGCDKTGVPIVEDSVYIGLNTTIVGGIHIKEDVLIAPNSFVNFNVPADSVVVGNPGCIHRKKNATDGYLLNVVR
ncbi:serine O-acetyltransferase [Brotaphodocola sp.]|uniref:serine O-acetyltransferase n=1 Tax=Brotaphodocola sp. TaxID=3073577 RepID=UPI003D7D929E